MASFKRTIKLVQQTPMIHFQAERANDGTLLRATEVKPKLDRFIYEWFRVKNGKEIPKEWLISEEHKALDYKLRFNGGNQQYNCGDPAPHFSKKNPGPSEEETGNLYFGNMGDGPRKHSLFYRTPVAMTILCFHPELMKTITECLNTFFLTVNFGTRQNKGFGGFVTENVARAKLEAVSKLLASWHHEASDTPVYRIAYNVRDLPQEAANNQELYGRAILRDISAIYQTLKSGFNYDFRRDNPQRYIKSYLTKYFWRRNISGEKRYMKVKGIAPVINRDPERELSQQDKDNHRTYRYIRGLLGSSGPQQWQLGGRDKETITFECAETEDSRMCARIPSPIFFKVVGTTLYIVPHEPLEKTYGVKFKFSSSLARGRNAEPIAIPTEQEFGSMKALFAEYVRALNGELPGDDTRNRLRGLSGMLNLSFVRNQNLKIEKCGG